MCGPFSIMPNFNMQTLGPYMLTPPFSAQFMPAFNIPPLFGGNPMGNWSMPNFMFNSCNTIFSIGSMPLMQNNFFTGGGFTPAITSTSKNKSSSTKTTKKAKLFDSNTTLSITKVTKGSMPYLLIGPKDVDTNEKLPVIVYLHGLYQVGKNPDLLDNYQYDPAVIMKKWNLKNFRGYILCPQTPIKSWCRSSVEKSLRGLLKEFESSHNVDKDNISLIGFSLGGAGALYMANEMSDVFKKAVALSPYEPGNLGSSMKIPTKVYAGGKDDNRGAGTPVPMVKNKLPKILGSENCTIVPGKGHGQLPGAVFNTDADNNGCSDVIEWLAS